MKYNETLTEQIRKGEAAFEFDKSKYDECEAFIKYVFPEDNDDAFRYKYIRRHTCDTYWIDVKETTIPVITITQLLEEEIEGYVLKEECKQYEEAACKICSVDDFKIDAQDGTSFLVNTHCYNKLKQSGVLDLWFNKVYKKKVQNWEIGDWAKDFMGNVSKIVEIKENTIYKEESGGLDAVFANGSTTWFTSIKKATPQEIEAAKKAAEKIMIKGSKYEIFVNADNFVISDNYFSKDFLQAAKIVAERSKAEVYVVCDAKSNGSNKWAFDLETINRILDRMKQL